MSDVSGGLARYPVPTYVVVNDEGQDCFELRGSSGHTRKSCPSIRFRFLSFLFLARRDRTRSFLFLLLSLLAGVLF